MVPVRPALLPIRIHGQQQCENRALGGVLGPDAALMAADDRLTDRQPEPAASPIAPAGITGVLFENPFHVWSRNARPRIAYIDPEGVYGRQALRKATGRRWFLTRAAVPIPGISANLNHSALWCELASIFQQIDEYLLHLRGLKMQRRRW